MDVDIPNWPLFAAAAPWVTTARPGDLLFIPAGSPHTLINKHGGPTVSISQCANRNLALTWEHLLYTTKTRFDSTAKQLRGAITDACMLRIGTTSIVLLYSELDLQLAWQLSPTSTPKPRASCAASTTIWARSVEPAAQMLRCCTPEVRVLELLRRASELSPHIAFGDNRTY
jgi:hypothetical protein